MQRHRGVTQCNCRAAPVWKLGRLGRGGGWRGGSGPDGGGLEHQAKRWPQDFPRGPVAKTSLSNAGGAGLTTAQGTKIPYATRPKNQDANNKSTIVTISIKT